MPDATIAACHIASLEHPITALADRPPLSAEDLKAYFDANPIQLMHAHNALVQTLSGTSGAENIGFANTAGVSASNVQSAIEQVQQQLSALALGSIPDGSITAVKLAASLQQQLDTIAQLQTTVEQMQTAEHASGTQFPFMILALSADTAETLSWHPLRSVCTTRTVCTASADSSAGCAAEKVPRRHLKPFLPSKRMQIFYPMQRRGRKLPISLRFSR